MRNVRLLSIIDYAVFSGPHNHDLRLNNALEANGIESCVLLPDEPGDALERLRDAGVKTATWPSHRSGVSRSSEVTRHARYLASLRQNVRAVRTILRNRSIDLVQLADPFHPHAAIAAKLERRPLVIHLVGMGGTLATRLMGSLIACRLADVIMTNGRYTKTAFPGVARSRVPVISYFSPVDIEIFKPDAERREKARRELGIQSGELVLGCIGRLNPEKDHRTCVRALATLRRRFPEARLVLMGSVDPNFSGYAASIREFAFALGLDSGSAIVFRDAGPRVAELAAAFDVCWSMGYHEGATTSVGEAMALGIPVVVAGNSSVREMVEDRQCGYLVRARSAEELAAATSPLLANIALRERMGQTARRRAVKLFSVDICADAHLKAYDIALQGSGGRYNSRRESAPSNTRSDSVYTES